LNRLSKTLRYAAVPMAPALGGNPNRTIPTFFSAFAFRRSSGQAPVFSTRLSIRSRQGAIALLSDDRGQL
jgi:hypothetical protein